MLPFSFFCWEVIVSVWLFFFSAVRPLLLCGPSFSPLTGHCCSVSLLFLWGVQLGLFWSTTTQCGKLPWSPISCEMIDKASVLADKATGGRRRHPEMDSLLRVSDLALCTDYSWLQWFGGQFLPASAQCSFCQLSIIRMTLAAIWPAQCSSVQHHVSPHQDTHLL